MLDIYLLRHSHVDYAPPNPIGDGNALTPLGHEMAALLADRCAEWAPQHLYASTMLRARQTADAISARWPELPRTDLDGLQETHLGDLAGYPGDLPPADQRAWQEAHYRYANGSLWHRVTQVFDQILAHALEHGLERIALVAHGGSLNVIIRHFLGYSPGVRWWECWFNLDWAASSCLRVDAERKWVRWVNDARHIDPLRHRLPPEDRL